MKKISRIYLGLVFLLLYLPIFYLIAYAFNAGGDMNAFTGFTLEHFQSLFGCGLLAFFLGIAFAYTALNALQEHLRRENRSPVAFASLLQQFERDADLVLLSPLNQLAFEVDFFIGDGVHTDVFIQNAALHELHAAVIAPVQINGSDECFKGIATHVAVV